MSYHTIHNLIKIGQGFQSSAKYDEITRLNRCAFVSVASENKSKKQLEK